VNLLLSEKRDFYNKTDLREKDSSAVSVLRKIGLLHQVTCSCTDRTSDFSRKFFYQIQRIKEDGKNRPFSVLRQIRLHRTN
jgi:hypothetical protein